MVLQIWCVLLVFERLSGFRNCVTSTDFVCKQLKKTCNTGFRDSSKKGITII